METTLARISELSAGNPTMKFMGLMPHFTEENLTRCFHELDGKKALGVDQVSKDAYGKDLAVNIANLVARLKNLSYRPQPSKEVLIPKGDGGSRPLGISSFEDKIVEMMCKKLLEAIYEPVFLDCSFGFRPNRNCHQAIAKLHSILYKGYQWTIIDLDLENFFGKIDHEKLCSILGLRISDKRFLRFIMRMLKSGILSEEGLKQRMIGTAQGSVCSPILANIFAHYAIDLWVTDVVAPRLEGQVHVVRYADDMCLCFTNKRDVGKVMGVLPKRLNRFGLSLNETKTKVIEWDKKKARSGDKPKPFDFLGFTFYLGKTKKGIVIPKIQTSGKKMRQGLKDLSDWIRCARNQVKMQYLWQNFLSKMHGHFQYFAVSFNSKRIAIFLRKAVRIMFKWLNRRSQRKSFSWAKFELFLARFPCPKPIIRHNLFEITVS